MEHILEEYGGVILEAAAGIFVLGGMIGLIFSGGILGQLIILFGNAAC
ncbi:MAG: hypothetical protein K2P76_07015 [Lachnospiraceae bacterium]|nr:hypothetical protein [Lachnospiraceae bacterium]MDE6980753.1 hypothetical protein [Lachnospiraceae bacterium]